VSSRSSTTRFTDRADFYNKHRPGYPPEVFDAIFQGFDDPATLSVADIGAGTGISTALLAQRVAVVYAVEPNAAMRSQAVELPNVSWHNGTAEHTGLPDACVDVAAAFQAFHWFDATGAFAEFRRIARRRIALVQYERDERSAFSKAYGDIVRRYATDDTEALRSRALERFSQLAGPRMQRTDVPSAQRLTLASMLGRVNSSSYLPSAGAAAAALRREIRDVFATAECDGSVELAMQVHVLTTQL
jgi:SAM-dependent methyltransferase